MNVLVRNYLWPAIYAVAAAVLAEVTRLLAGHEPLSGTSLAIAGGAALLTFASSRLNPHAGRGEPYVEPHS